MREVPCGQKRGNADEITDKMRRGRTDRGRTDADVDAGNDREEKSITLPLYLLCCCQSLNLADYTVRTAYDLARTRSSFDCHTGTNLLSKMAREERCVSHSGKRGTGTAPPGCVGKPGRLGVFVNLAAWFPTRRCRPWLKATAGSVLGTLLNLNGKSPEVGVPN